MLRLSLTLLALTATSLGAPLFAQESGSPLWPVSGSDGAPALQQPVQPQAGQPGTPGTTGQPQDRGVDFVFGGVGVPAAPRGQSTSVVTRTPRPALNYQGARGTTSDLRVRVRDLCRVRGQENNRVHGLGLVTGLAGTGDSGNAARTNLTNLLRIVNVNLDPSQVASNNIAIVWVEANLPAGVKPGRTLDARVSSLYDAESLLGGSLVWCELTDPAGTTVYGTAGGPITVGGFSASGDGVSATQNHLTVGLVSQGVKVEKEVPARLITDQGFVYLDLLPKTGGFGNAVRVADAIGERFPGSAVPTDAMTVRVAAPEGLAMTDEVRFVGTLLEIGLEPEASSRIVINERTGTIVLGEQVRIGRGAITKGNLTVTIAETPEASQPAPFSQGTTEILPRTDLLIEEQDRGLSLINGAASLSEVVEVLNVLGVTPRDMIDILQSMAQAGMLHGELIVQ